MMAQLKRKRNFVAEDQALFSDLPVQDRLFPFFKKFAETMTEKLSVPFPGEPEDQLRNPLDKLFDSYGRIISRPFRLVGEAALGERMGRPDFAGYREQTIIGYIELKAPDAFRSFDRQFVIPDNRLADFFRPSLWQVLNDQQVFLASLFNHPLGHGPAISVCALVPDRHYYRGSYGGKDILPLFRDKFAAEPNILPGLLSQLSKAFRRDVLPEDLAGYVYALLGQPAYTSRFEIELGGRKIRLPLTKDPKLFFKAAEYRMSSISEYQA